MALVPCPECHKEVSTEAWACPQCAFPFPGKPLTPGGRPGLRSHVCPQCHNPIPRHAQSCPRCEMLVSGGPGGHQEPHEEPIQQTEAYPPSGSSLTRKTPQTSETRTGLQDTTPAVTLESVPEPPPIRTVDISRKNQALQGSRKRIPLWQDPSVLQEASLPRHPRTNKQSILVGLILLVIVAMSVLFGAIWQLKGFNPLEAILYWRM